MDLLLLLAVLYAWECLKTIPPHGVVFTSMFGRAWRVRYGGGIHFFLPWPSAHDLVSAWFPFRVEGERLRSAVPLGRTGLPDHRDDDRCVTLRTGSLVTTAGALLKVDGVAFLRGTSPLQVRCLRRICLRIAARAPARRTRAWHAALHRSWDAQSAGHALSRVRGATRRLTTLCSIYVALVFLAAPVAIVLLGEETALLALVPITLLVHAAAVMLLHRASGSLQLPFGPARWERTVVAALYPPALWRAPQEIASEALIGFGPNALAGALLHGDELGAFVRRRMAILQTERARCDAEEGATDTQLEQRSLRQLRNAREVDPAAALDPTRGDPDAAAYCPVCLSSYLPGIDMCGQCSVGTLPRAADYSTRYATDTTP